MLTPTDRRIVQKRRSKGGVLLPIFETLLEKQLAIEDDADIDFMVDLIRRRNSPREKGVFSPSMLGSCVRQAYFAKTGQERRSVFNPQTHAYFLEGDFKHYKWQFALWKAHRAGLLELARDDQPFPNAQGCEVRVRHPSKDFSGTIDGIPIIDGVPYVVDFKGINLRAFQMQMRQGAALNYRIQIVGYAMIYQILNKVPVSECLLVAENKPGPITGQNPLALHEDVIRVASYRAEVKKRLRALRRYVENEEVPPPACTSTRHKEFQECAFSWFCREEIKAIQAKAEKTHKASGRRKLSVARISGRADKNHRQRSLPGQEQE